MKKVSKIKKKLAIILIFLFSINSFAASVNHNDGSAFITKAEFDALKSSFQSQIDTYNQGIDSKIDEAIAGYLSGIKMQSVFDQVCLLDGLDCKFGYNYDWPTQEMATFNLSGESTWAMTNDVTRFWRARRIMNDTTLLHMTFTDSKSHYGGAKGKYYYVQEGTYGNQLIEYWTDYIVNHYFVGANSASGSGTKPSKNPTVWPTITPFKDQNTFGAVTFGWGPNSGDVDWRSTTHIALVNNTHNKQNIDVAFCNTMSDSSKLCIKDVDSESTLDYAQGRVDLTNSTWGWVTSINWSGGTLTTPANDTITYYLKKPKTTSIKPSSFVHNKLSNKLEKAVTLTGGMPFVKCSDTGKLEFDLKMTCNTTGKTAKFGLSINTPFSNSNSISTLISGINLVSSDYNYNLDTAKILHISFNVAKGDVIYLKADTQSLVYDTSKTYYITPQITNIKINTQK